jgi:glycerophosphoryl diester phosphodiesterase
MFVSTDGNAKRQMISCSNSSNRHFQANSWLRQIFTVLVVVCTSVFFSFTTAFQVHTKVIHGSVAQLQAAATSSDDSCKTRIVNDHMIAMSDTTSSISKSLRQTLGLDQNCTGDTTPSLKVKKNRPQIIGHRGALYDALENTRYGFQKCAREIKCDGVELDVFLLPKDGTLIVFHGGGDDTNPGDLSEYCLNMTNKNIMELTYEEVLRLQFNPSFSEFPCPRECITDVHVAYVPTLEQVLQDFKSTPSCRVTIELKGPNVTLPVVEIVEKLQMQSQCCYSSFNLERLYELRSLRPCKNEFPTGALFDGTVPANFIELARDAGATEIHLKYDTCTRHRIQEIHKAGMGSMAWFRGPIGMIQDMASKYHDVGNEDESCYQALIDCGVQQICCNKPNLLVSMMRST